MTEGAAGFFDRIVARGIEGVATRMIGRDAELATLQEAFGRVFRERKLAAVTVVGEAGSWRKRRRASAWGSGKAIGSIGAGVPAFGSIGFVAFFEASIRAFQSVSTRVKRSP